VHHGKKKQLGRKKAKPQEKKEAVNGRETRRLPTRESTREPGVRGGRDWTCCEDLVFPRRKINGVLREKKGDKKKDAISGGYNRENLQDNFCKNVEKDTKLPQKRLFRKKPTSGSGKERLREKPAGGPTSLTKKRGGCQRMGGTARFT